jgi:hypothetical protein
MKIHFDPVVVSRIKSAWGKLEPAQKRMILPMLLKAHAQAVAVSQTKAARATLPRGASVFYRIEGRELKLVRAESGFGL